MTFRTIEVIGKLYYVRFADETVGRSVVDKFWITKVLRKLYYVRFAHEYVGGSVVDIFWITKVLGKLYYVRSADEPSVVRRVLVSL